MSMQTHTAAESTASGLPLPQKEQRTPSSNRPAYTESSPSSTQQLAKSLCELAAAIRELGFDFSDEAFQELSPASISILAKTKSEGTRALKVLCRLLILDGTFDATFPPESQ